MLREWDAIKLYARDLAPDMTFQTTLLGTVGCREIGGVLIGTIPSDLQATAKKHGFAIVAASYRGNAYTLRKLSTGDKT